MVTYDDAVDRAIYSYSSYLFSSDENIRHRIDSKLYSWSQISRFKESDLYMCFGIARGFRIIFPDQIVRNDVFIMRLESLYDQSVEQLRHYYETVLGSIDWEGLIS